MDTAPKTSWAERQDEHAQRIASLLIKQMQSNTAPWQIPWEQSSQGQTFPQNALTQKPYRGGNALYLWATQIEKGYGDNRWLTYNQATELGETVRKGEHGTGICYIIKYHEIAKKDSHGNAVIGADGKPEKIFVKNDPPRVKFYTVFNANQIDGLPEREPERKRHEWDIHTQAERIINGAQARIQHDAGSAYYLAGVDTVFLPAKDRFSEPGKYYASALHEIAHSTGHKDRLDRDQSGGFGSESYAKEELVAEISSLLTGQEIGLGHDPSQHTAYVKSWIQILQDQPKEILTATSKAQQASEMVMGYDHEIAYERALKLQQIEDLKREREDHLVGRKPSLNELIYAEDHQYAH